MRFVAYGVATDQVAPMRFPHQATPPPTTSLVPRFAEPQSRLLSSRARQVDKHCAGNSSSRGSSIAEFCLHTFEGANNRCLIERARIYSIDHLHPR